MTAEPSSRTLFGTGVGHCGDGVDRDRGGGGAVAPSLSVDGVRVAMIGTGGGIGVVAESVVAVVPSPKVHL